jgi:hypothetical protein
MYEHQSTYNPNMPLRNLIYVTGLFADIVKNENLFGSKLVKIPTPRFVVFYNGTDPRPEWEQFRLSDAYLVHMDEPEMELVCTVININPGCNRELLSKCPVLEEYSVFVDLVRKYGRMMDMKQAVDRAIDECIENDILREFLESQRAEVNKMSVLDFNLEKQLRFEREEGREEGIEQGIEQGREEGINSIVEAVKLLRSGMYTTAEELETAGVESVIAEKAMMIVNMS